MATGRGQGAAQQAVQPAAQPPDRSIKLRVVSLATKLSLAEKHKSRNRENRDRLMTTVAEIGTSERRDQIKTNRKAEKSKMLLIYTEFD